MWFSGVAVGEACTTQDSYKEVTCMNKWARPIPKGFIWFTSAGKLISTESQNFEKPPSMADEVNYVTIFWISEYTEISTKTVKYKHTEFGPIFGMPGYKLL